MLMTTTMVATTLTDPPPLMLMATSMATAISTLLRPQMATAMMTATKMSTMKLMNVSLPLLTSKRICALALVLLAVMDGQPLSLLTLYVTLPALSASCTHCGAAQPTLLLACLSFSVTARTRLPLTTDCCSLFGLGARLAYPKRPRSKTDPFP